MVINMVHVGYMATRF